MERARWNTELSHKKLNFVICPTFWGHIKTGHPFIRGIPSDYPLLQHHFTSAQNLKDHYFKKVLHECPFILGQLALSHAFLYRYLQATIN